MAEVARKLGISDVTVYTWRKRFGQLEAVDLKRVRQLEHENSRLKKLPAERGRSIRRACALRSAARSTVRYESRLVCDAPEWL